MTIQANDQNFDQEVSSFKGVTVVDFWAEWCGPCKVMLPIFEKFGAEIVDEAKVVKVNVDESPETAQKFRIMSIPTILIFKDGEVVEQLVGVQEKETLKQLVAKHK